MCKTGEQRGQKLVTWQASTAGPLGGVPKADVFLTHPAIGAQPHGCAISAILGIGRPQLRQSLTGKALGYYATARHAARRCRQPLQSIWTRRRPPLVPGTIHVLPFVESSCGGGNLRLSARSAAQLPMARSITSGLGYRNSCTP